MTMPMTDLQARYVLHLAEWIWQRQGQYAGEHCDRPAIYMPTWSVYGAPTLRESVTISSRTIDALVKLRIVEHVPGGRVTLSYKGWRLVPEAYAQIWWSDFNKMSANVCARHRVKESKRRLRLDTIAWWPGAWAAAWGRIGAYYAADCAHPMTLKPREQAIDLEEPTVADAVIALHMNGGMP